MQLQEIMNKPYSWEWTKRTHRLYEASFKNERGNKIVVDMQYGDIDDLWNISFALDPGYGQPKIMDKTKTGDEFKIFSTVMDIIGKFIKKEKPDNIGFSADGRSRIKLYDAFEKRYSKKLGYKFKGKDSFAGLTTYKFEKIR
jgi:hypothetical protein